MEEWKECKLGDLCIDNKGSYGIAASAVPYSEDLYTYLRITDINDDGTLNKSDLKSVADENAEQYILQPNDIVFARTGGSTGRNYFYDGSDGVFVYAGFLIKFSIDPNKVNPKYIKYFCLSQEYKNWVYSFNTGSTRGNINAQTYANMPVIIPPRPQQDLLVNTLSSLDDKIELNNKINTNLEQQAQALFKNWFVDFEPFGGKMPEGWKVGKLLELINVKYGKDHKKLNDGNYPVYGSGGIMRYVDKFLYDKESVLIPRKGTLNNVFYINEPFWSVDTMFYTEMKKENIAKYVYFFVKSKDLNAMNAGSAVPSMTTEILNAMEVVIPSDEYLERFETIVSPMFKQIKQCIIENENLASIRDTLLPKLMNGEMELTQ